MIPDIRWEAIDFIASQHHSVPGTPMPKKTSQPPQKKDDAEIIVKQNFGLSIGLFSQSGLDFYPGVAIFANRNGCRFLADYFAWLAERPIATFDRNNSDPGDHVHLTPHSDYGDEIDFTIDTLTPENRRHVLRNAGATKPLRRRGTPIQQFTQLMDEMSTFLNGFCENDANFRETTSNDIKDLVRVLKKTLSQFDNFS